MAPFGACRGCPIWSTVTILPSPAVTKRPPGAEVSNASPLPPLICVTLRDPTDTHRRNGRIRKSHVRLLLTTGRSLSDGRQSLTPENAGLFEPGPYVLGLSVQARSPLTSQRETSRTVTSQPQLASARAVSLSPGAEEPTDYSNYRQCRDNPPQFYGMLCHEVFAPHSQLHALRGINAPSSARRNTLMAEPGSTRTRD